MTQPFIVYGLPRSRTKWLSVFLTYREWVCCHETSMNMRSLVDVRRLLSQPNTGTSETAACYGRFLIKYLFPNIKEVVVFRPVDEVVNSVLNVDVSGVATYPPILLRKVMEYGYRCLKKIAKDPYVLVVNYADLEKEETCRSIFEHCLPYRFDKAWWESLKDKNIQIDAKELLRYRFKYSDEIKAFKHHCKMELIRLCRIGEIKKGHICQ